MPNKSTQDDVRGSRNEQNMAVSQGRFMSLATKISNKTVFAVSELMVSSIWDLVKGHLMEDHRGKHTYDIVPIKYDVRNEEYASQEQARDLWEDKVITRTYALLRFGAMKESAGEPVTLENSVAIAHFDAVLTSAGFQIFGMKDEGGNLRREKEPLINAYQVDNYRLDDLSIGEVHKWVDRSLKHKSGQPVPKALNGKVLALV